MAINTPIDPMAELEALMNTKDEVSTSFAPFFFSIKDGQKALVRPLLNLNQYVNVGKHEIWNPATKKFEVKAVCASSVGVPGCVHCAKAAQAKSKEEKKLIASTRIILAIYVHAVLDCKTGQPITYTKTNEDGSTSEEPVKGVRLLEMKKTSDILSALFNSWNGTDDSDIKATGGITSIDYVIRREGEGTNTRYVVTPKKPRDITDEIPEWTHDRDQVLLQYAEACPFEIEGGSEEKLNASAFDKKPATPGKKTVPDF